VQVVLSNYQVWIAPQNGFLLSDGKMRICKGIFNWLLFRFNTKFFTI